MDFITEIFGDGNDSDDLQVVTVESYIGDGVTAVSTCPKCGQVHSVYLPDSVASDYDVDGLQTVLTLVPSNCAVCDCLAAIDGVTVTVDSVTPAQEDCGRVWISYACTDCGGTNENLFHLEWEEERISEIIGTFGDSDRDYYVTIHAVCDDCACAAYHAQERAERNKALADWRANHNPILDGLTYAHGLSAYRGSRSVQEIFQDDMAAAMGYDY